LKKISNNHNRAEMRIAFTTALVLVAGMCFAQKKLIKGIVVDSLTLEALSGVHVVLRNSGTIAVTDLSGIYAVVASANDTLTFSYVGYSPAIRTVDLNEEIMFVRLRDESLLLKEIVIRDTRLPGTSGYNRSVLSTIKPLAASPGSVNFAYFSKLEKEKRKLVAVIEELERARIYIEIVTDPDFRYNMMSKYKLSEDQFYELLAVFNQTHHEPIHSSNELLIMYTLYSYFEYATLQE
jgi:hypothetical protein